MREEPDAVMDTWMDTWPVMDLRFKAEKGGEDGIRCTQTLHGTAIYADQLGWFEGSM